MADYSDIEYETYRKQELVDQVHLICNEWVERLGGNRLHGGERPDYADFRMFAELMRVGSLPTMKGILAKRPLSCEFMKWYKLMARSCAPQNRF